VLLWLLREAPQPLYLTQGPPDGRASAFTECPVSCRPVPLTRCSVAELLNSFPQSPNRRTGDLEQTQKYTALLVDAVHDGRLTYEEARRPHPPGTVDATDRPTTAGASPESLGQGLPGRREIDWHALPPVERREMYLLADALGLST
jgi:hypothetical protein